MKTTFITISTFITILFLTTVVRASDTIWTDNFETAKIAAKREGKDLLLHFTGSDWCPWCIKLKKEVFSQETFKKEAPNHFVLVDIDFPRTKEQSEKVKKQNRELEKRYQVEGFPTIILTDNGGRPYARTGYQEGGPDNFLKHLQELRTLKIKRDTLFEKAENSQGVEQAKILDQALNLLKSNGINSLNEYSDIIDKIIKYDKENSAGLRTNYEVVKVQYESSDRLSSIMSDLDHNLSIEYGKAIKELEALIEFSKPVPEIVQNIYLKMAELYQEGKKDDAAWFKNLEKAAEVAPHTNIGKRILELLEEIKHNS